MINYYQFLNLPETITQEKIEIAFDQFRNELKKFSPGIEISDSELRSRKPEIWDAYVVLLNPLSRKEHDELLERDRIHKLYEEQNRVEKPPQVQPFSKWKYIGLGVASLIILVYFLFGKFSSDNLSDKPDWRTHYITDKIRIALPAALDSSDRFGSVYLLYCAEKPKCIISKISGFSISVGEFVFNNDIRISPKEAALITNMEMQNPHIRLKKLDTLKINFSINEYSGQLERGTYQIDNVIRAFENYTLLKDNEVIKVIVNYIPENAEHEKYCEFVFKSLMQ